MTVYEVIEKIETTLNEHSPEISMGKDTAITVASVVAPPVGATMTIINSFLSNYDEYKLNHLLFGLSLKSNTEKALNELYNYVAYSSEKAYRVGNVLKKALASESPKSNVLMGLVLANNMNNKTAFSRDDIIVCRALENANDYDLNNFRTIMHDCIVLTKDNKRIIEYDFNDVSMNYEYNMTCSWAIYNRLFTQSLPDLKVSESTMIHSPSHIYVEHPADTLYELITALGKVWNYGS